MTSQSAYQPLNDLIGKTVHRGSADVLSGLGVKEHVVKRYRERFCKAHGIDMELLDQTWPVRLRDKPAPTPRRKKKPVITDPDNPRLVGNVTRRMLREMGIGFWAGCNCKEMIEKMNNWGPDGCRKHMEEIVDHMETTAEKNTALRIAKKVATALMGEEFTRNKAREIVENAIEEVLSYGVRAE